MSKLGAMMRYELLMAWRRRSLAVLGVLLLVGMIGFGLIVESTSSTLALQGAVSDASPWLQGIDLVVAANTFKMINLTVAVMVIFGVGVALMTVETIPLDRQFRVRELLDTLPITRALYLGGKLFGVWSGLLLILMVVGAAGALAIRLIFGAYDLRVFLLMWGIMLAPPILATAAVSVLVAAFAGSRRLAILIGLGVLPFVVVLFFTTAVSLASIGALVEPIYSLAMLITPGSQSSAEVLNSVMNTLLSLVVVVLAVWAFVWAWARVRAARQ